MPDAKQYAQDVFLLDVTVKELRHEYDPVKAREYYLRTRELKGRKTGAIVETRGKTSSLVGTSESAVKARADLRAQAARRKAAAEKRVADLKARLKQLEELLDKLVEQAKARSGVEPKSKPSDKPKAGTPDKKLTLAQKKDAAKKAKERRDKERDPSLDEEAKALEAKIKMIRERIEKMKAQLADAQRKAASRTSKTASISRSSNTKERR